MGVLMEILRVVEKGINEGIDSGGQRVEIATSDWRP